MFNLSFYLNILLLARAGSKTDLGQIFLYFLYFLVIIIPLALIVKFVNAINRSSNISRIDKKIKTVGLEEIIIREINNKEVDDTFTRAVIGYLAAGDLGMVAGAASGEITKEPVSITFWLRFEDESKDIITLPPDNRFSRRLLKLIEEQDFNNW